MLVRSYLSERIELEELARELDRLPHHELRSDVVARQAIRILGEATSAHLDEDVIVHKLRRLVAPYKANRIRTRGDVAGILVKSGKVSGKFEVTVRSDHQDASHAELRVHHG